MDSVLQKSPFPRGNSADILNYLEELILVHAKEEGFFPISEDKGGYQDLAIGSTNAVSLFVPENAISAVLIIEAHLESSLLHRVVRFKENGTTPTATSGFALGDNDIFSIVGRHNLNQFRIIGIDTNLTHVARIQFFETNQFKHKPH